MYLILLLGELVVGELKRRHSVHCAAHAGILCNAHEFLLVRNQSKVRSKPERDAVLLCFPQSSIPAVASWSPNTVGGGLARKINKNKNKGQRFDTLKKTIDSQAARDWPFLELTNVESANLTRHKRELLTRLVPKPEGKVFPNTHGRFSTATRSISFPPWENTASQHASTGARGRIHDKRQPTVLLTPPSSALLHPPSPSQI